MSHKLIQSLSKTYKVQTRIYKVVQGGPRSSKVVKTNLSGNRHHTNGFIPLGWVRGHRLYSNPITESLNVQLFIGVHVTSIRGCGQLVKGV